MSMTIEGYGSGQLIATEGFSCRIDKVVYALCVRTIAYIRALFNTEEL